MINDATLARINQGVQLHHHQGQREAARDLFAQIWDEIGGQRGDPLHICVLAHAMADVQDGVQQELTGTSEHWRRPTYSPIRGKRRPG